jgi:flagellar motility protein MotE (MotC chaperone)
MSHAGTRLLNLTALGLFSLLVLQLSEPLSIFLPSDQGIGTAVAATDLGSEISRSIGAFRNKSGASLDIVTGASDAPPATKPPINEKTSEKSGTEEKPNAPAKPNGEGVPTISVPDSADKLLLERLAARRLELDKRDKDISDREALLAAAEKQIEARISELKSLDEALKLDIARKEADIATLKPVITMYETMKPKEAARIFEKLDLKAVLPIAGGMNPKKFSEVLAQLDPVVAGKITVGLAALNGSSSNALNGKVELPELVDIAPTKTR